MKKKMISAAVSLCLILSAAVPVFASENSMSNFKAGNTYNNVFTDVAASHWAAPSVKTCYEYGLMKGNTASTFNPNGNLTIAQALVMADRVHEIYRTGESTLRNGSTWYQPYVDYAIENNIIKKGEFTNYNAPVTRAQMASFFYNALPASELKAINAVNKIPDISGNPHADKILALYQAGVLTGSDIYGTFHPNNSIKRSEAAAIIARVAIPAERRSISLMDKYVWKEDSSVVMTLPQDASDLSSLLGMTAFGSEDMTAMVLSIPMGIPGGFDITILSPADVNLGLSQGMAESGQTFHGAKSDLVTFGSTKAYRTTGTVDTGDFQQNCVIFTYITKTGSMNAVALLTYEDDALLKQMVNNLTIGGKTASPQMK